MRKLLIIAFLAALLSQGTVSRDNGDVQSEEEGSTAHGAFPITVDFECPRNYGFHIGDEIPLTVTLEASQGHIVDLVNLPQKGETHGPFEVRNVSVRRRQKSNGTVYTVFYKLQAFQPAIAVDRLSFPPLRISYATKKDWNAAESKYHYQTLFSQPFDIFVSRTATYFGPMKDIKGAIEDEATTAIWTVTVVVGSLMVLAAFITWPWQFIRKGRRVGEQSLPLTAKDRALEALQGARERCFNYEDHRKHLFFEINTILRNFLKDVHGLDTANRPSMEIVKQLRDCQFYEDLKALVTRINQVIYEGDAPADVESVMRQFSELVQRIDGPTPSKDEA